MNTDETQASVKDTVRAKVRELRYGASDLARKGSESVSDAGFAAQRQLGDMARATGRYVEREPVKAALLAAAAGATVAALVLAAWRRKHTP